LLPEPPSKLVVRLGTSVTPFVQHLFALFLLLIILGPRHAARQHSTLLKIFGSLE
jgi:hypothetical protein